MTKKEILAEGYTIDNNGIIQSLGQFEAEPLHIVHFYDIYMNGCALDTADPDTVVIPIGIEDRKEFPTLKGCRKAYLTFSDQGFVSIDCR